MPLPAMRAWRSHRVEAALTRLLSPVALGLFTECNSTRGVGLILQIASISHLSTSEQLCQLQPRMYVLPLRSQRHK